MEVTSRPSRAFTNQWATSRWPCPSVRLYSKPKLNANALRQQVAGQEVQVNNEKQRKISLIISFLPRSSQQTHLHVRLVLFFLSDGFHHNTLLKFRDKRKHDTEGAPPWGRSFGVTQLVIKPVTNNVAHNNNQATVVEVNWQTGERWALNPKQGFSITSCSSCWFLTISKQLVLLPDTTSRQRDRMTHTKGVDRLCPDMMRSGKIKADGTRLHLRPGRRQTK